MIGMLGFKESLLFKYRGFDANSLSILINQAMYFSHPSEFNDPFDGQLDIFNGLKRLADVHKEIELADEEELVKQVKTIAETFKEIGVLSMCEKPDSILMWSHYADKHKGFCLGFSRNGLNDDFGTTQNPADYSVQYLKPVPLMELKERYDELSREYGITPLTFLEADIHLILTQYKCEDWQYEKEVRFVNQNVSAREFNPKNLKCVIFGIQTPSRIKVTIKNLLEKLAGYKNVKVFQAKRIPGEFKVITKPANEDDYFIDGDGNEAPVLNSHQ